MKKEIEDLTGRKFGRLTVLERGANDNSRGTKQKNSHSKNSIA